MKPIADMGRNSEIGAGGPGSSRASNRQPTRPAHYNAKPVQQLKLNGTVVRVWPSVSEAAQHIANTDVRYRKTACDTNISATARNEHRTAYGYKWKYVDAPTSPASSTDAPPAKKPRIGDKATKPTTNAPTKKRDREVDDLDELRKQMAAAKANRDVRLCIEIRDKMALEIKDKKARLTTEFDKAMEQDDFDAALKLQEEIESL